jgi:hypothetical protein
MYKLLITAVLFLSITAPNVLASSTSGLNTQESILDFEDNENWQDTVEVDHPLMDNPAAKPYPYKIINPYLEYQGKDHLLPTNVTVSSFFSILDVPGIFVDSWGNAFIGEDYYGHMEFLVACIKETSSANELILCRKDNAADASSLSIADYLDMPDGYFYDAYNEYISLSILNPLDIWSDLQIINDKYYRTAINNAGQEYLAYYGSADNLTVGWSNELTQDESGWVIINKQNGLQALPLFEKEVESPGYNYEDLFN